MKFDKKYSFDEEAEAVEILKNGFPDGNINYIGMQKVAKYYRNVLNFGKKRLENAIIDFCKQQNPDFNPVIEAESIKKWIRSAETHNLRKINEIIITKSEMDAIKGIKNLKNRKVLFATLVLAKAVKQGKTGKAISTKNTDKYFINYSNLLDIAKLSGMKITEIQIADIFYEFGKDGLMTFYSPERESILLTFTNDASEVALTITNPENFMDYYKEYFGGDVIACSICGAEVIKKSGTHTRCESCSKEIKKKKDAEWVKNKRKKMSVEQ